MQLIFSLTSLLPQPPDERKNCVVENLRRHRTDVLVRDLAVLRDHEERPDRPQAHRCGDAEGSRQHNSSAHPEAAAAMTSATRSIAYQLFVCLTSAGLVAAALPTAAAQEPSRNFIIHEAPKPIDAIQFEDANGRFRSL